MFYAGNVIQIGSEAHHRLMFMPVGSYLFDPTGINGVLQSGSRRIVSCL